MTTAELTDAQVIALECAGVLHIKRIMYREASPFRTGYYHADAEIKLDPNHIYRRNGTRWNLLAARDAV